MASYPLVPDSGLFKKKLTRVALSWSNLVQKTNVSKLLLNELKANSFLTEDEHQQLVRESEKMTYHLTSQINCKLIGLLLTKMQAYGEAMIAIQNPNLIANQVLLQSILDPFDLFMQVWLLVKLLNSTHIN